MANPYWIWRFRIGLEFLVLSWMVLPASCATAQAQYLYPNFFQLAEPKVLNAIAFAGGFGSENYGTIQEGLQLDQSITRYVGIVGRITGYQLWIGDNFDNPLSPGSGTRGRLNFVRVQGGAEFTLYPGTTLFVLGGGDAGDSTAAVIEGDGSSWVMTHSRHPVNFSFSAIHDYENQVTSSEMDLRMVAASTETYLLTAGGGGALYSGGTISGVAGQGGPDLGIYFRNWGLGVFAQAGYGNAGGFGQLSIVKQSNFTE